MSVKAQSPQSASSGISTTQFDVFLAHNTQDKPQVRAIALALKQRNIKPWLDEEQIPPGRSFQDEIQQAIPLVKSAAIFIGSQGLGRWQSWELKTFIAECVENKIPVIPVLLPGVNNLPEDLVFLKQLRWVAFSNGVDDEAAINLLAWGITGENLQSREQLQQKPGKIPTKSVLQNIDASQNRRIQSNSPNFFAYDDAWVGRDSLIQELSERIRRHCRLLILVGITGIGKTALGERLAVEVADWFENDWSHYRQENFDDEQQTSDFASVAARWLEKWGELITPDDRKDPQRLLNRLIRHLRENRYLVQMDSLENILQGNEDEGWSDFKDEWWLKFFDGYLKAESCESCFILTSQDLPGQIEEVGTRSQNFWYCQPLSGLEKSEQIALFEKTELDVSPNSTSRTYLERIGSAYEGHPLALRVIAGEIKNKPFNGNVSAYWNRYGNEVEEVEKAIAEAQEGNTFGADDQFKLDRFTKTLRRNVRSRLNKTFKRLQEDAKWAYIMLCETSVYRCAVPEDFWLSHLEDWDRNEDEQRLALDALRDRYLVEQLVDKDQYLLRQHNLIRSLSLECLKQLGEEYE
ncbi:toll/interleukin-1 receptor domain-containing protein [Aulosira sp. FACHB-615]|nr:toll/interleukin-1 receptor domain-containing protein [Aulosira sp. FACHB-615]